MSFKKKNPKLVVFKNLIVTSPKLHRFGNKKIIHLISKLLFSSSHFVLNKKQFLTAYVWFFTRKSLFSLQDEENNNHTNNCFHAMSLKYLRSSSKDLTKDLKTEALNKKVIRKALKNYVTYYLKDFHKKENFNIGIRYLRQRQETTLPKIFFEPWKKSTLSATKRQHWLKTTYNRYQNLRFSDQIDFFRTYMGQIIGNFYSKKANWHFPYHKPLPRTYLKFRFSHTKGWWYENLVQRTQNPRSAKRFLLDRPKTAFQIHWTQQKQEPWKNSLLFKRALYAGFGEDYRKENKFSPIKIKDYLRSKNPRREKRNRLYVRANFLLNNFRQRYRIRADKFMRIKQVVSKIVHPFYGHLRPKQMQILLKKSKNLKTNKLGLHEIVLSRLENRLDVVVFRLNLAPSILWARRLIKAGLIFVTPARSDFLWESMYRGLKKLSFPLKLRDPKSLYTRTYWNFTQEDWVEFKFLGQPKKKISYLLQPGDLIQCAPGTSLNHFKTQSWLCRKPIPGHLLIQKKKNYVWHWHLEQFKKQTFKSWEQSSESIFSAIFLNSPQYRDLDMKDRIKESFLRWAMF